MSQSIQHLKTQLVTLKTLKWQLPIIYADQNLTVNQFVLQYLNVNIGNKREFFQG